MRPHAAETDLALFATGDLHPWRAAWLRLHVNRCAACREAVEAFRADRDRLRREAMPPEIDWERLAAEMAANIRLGLEAGECVAPRRSKHPAWSFTRWNFGPIGFGWKIAGGLAAATALVGVALWLNFPASDQAALSKAVSQMFRGRPAVSTDEAGPVVEASSTGIELRENGGAVRISQGTLRPVAVSVSAQGSASARYVDADTGQVTITSVYVQ